MFKGSKEYNVINDKFPHVTERISFLWGNKECTDYLYRLIDDTRDGERKGFPAEVFYAILDTINLHDVAFPQHARKFLDIWETNHYN